MLLRLLPSYFRHSDFRHSDDVFISGLYIYFGKEGRMFDTSGK